MKDYTNSLHIVCIIIKLCGEIYYDRIDICRLLLEKG